MAEDRIKSSHLLATDWRDRIPENHFLATTHYSNLTQENKTTVKIDENSQLFIDYWHQRAQPFIGEHPAEDPFIYPEGNHVNLRHSEKNKEQAYSVAWHDNDASRNNRPYQEDRITVGKIDIEPSDAPLDLEQFAFDLSFSFGLTFANVSEQGATACITLQYQQKIVTANVGDSSAGLFIKTEDEYVYHPLSWPQAAGNQKEQKRIGIEEKEGHIWLSKEQVPRLLGREHGVIPTRSWGDSQISGLNFCPEVVTYTLDNNPAYLFSHSDGMITPYQILEEHLNDKTSPPLEIENLPERACLLSLKSHNPNETQPLYFADRVKTDNEKNPVVQKDNTFLLIKHLRKNKDNVSASEIELNPNDNKLRFSAELDNHGGEGISHLAKILFEKRLTHFINLQKEIKGWFSENPIENLDQIKEILNNEDTSYWKEESTIIQNEDNPDVIKLCSPGGALSQHELMIHVVYLQYIYHQIQNLHPDKKEDLEKQNELLNFIEQFLLIKILNIKNEKTKMHIQAIMGTLFPVDSNLQNLAEFVISHTHHILDHNNEISIEKQQQVLQAYSNYYKAQVRLGNHIKDIPHHPATLVSYTTNEIGTALVSYHYSCNKTVKQLDILTDILNETSDSLEGKKALSPSYFNKWKQLSIPWDKKQKLGLAMAMFGVGMLLLTGYVVLSIFCPLVPIISIVSAVTVKTLLISSAGASAVGGFSFGLGLGLFGSKNETERQISYSAQQFSTSPVKTSP